MTARASPTRAGRHPSYVARRLQPDTDQFAELQSWIEEVQPGPKRVLDVGGGGTFYDFASRLRPSASRMVGVDPDPSVLERSWFDEARADTVERYAGSAGEVFDLALCVYVVEHVEDPRAFLGAVRSVLRPGGSCFGITPNLLHYFGLASATTNRIGVDEWLLHRLRPPELIEAYHSPLRYRMNSPRALSASAGAAGFTQVELRFLEQPGMFETYFPDWMRWWPRAYSAGVNGLGMTRLHGTVIFRLTA